MYYKYYQFIYKLNKSSITGLPYSINTEETWTQREYLSSAKVMPIIRNTNATKSFSVFQQAKKREKQSKTEI